MMIDNNVVIYSSENFLPRTIVYGLGDIYKKNKQRIENMYNVVGYCDRDTSKLPKKKGLTRNELKLSPDSYDIILVATAPVMVVPDLIENLGVPSKKIHVLFYDDVERLGRYEMQFYGLFQEDAALLLSLQLLNMRPSEIRYLEIGCNDPVHDNNSFNLYRMGARGVLVDPLPGIRELVNWMRPEDKFMQLAVSGNSASKMQPFYASDDDQLGSLNAKHHERFSTSKAHKIHEIQVHVIGINDLMKRIGFIPNILLVDAEGEDENILYKMDYQKYRPVIIIVEICHGNGSKLETFMLKEGYCVFMRIADSNTIFILEEAIEQKVLWRD